MTRLEERSMERPPDILTQRLSMLDLPVPPRLVPRALATAANSRRQRMLRGRRILITVGAAVAVVAGNLGLSYASPRYAQALASAPLAGTITAPLLQQAGLTGADPQLIDVQDSQAGYTVRVFGGYADAVRTTLFVQIETADGKSVPDGTGPAARPTLTDQFGHTYLLRNGYGMPVLNFEPLVWPASAVGARLTLHIDSLDLPISGSTASTTVSGPWNMSFDLTDMGGHALSVPAPVQVGDTTYTFSSVTLTSTVLEVRWTISGGAIERSQALHSSPRSGSGSGQADYENYQELATARLLDSDGHVIQPAFGTGQGVRRDGTDVAMEMDSWYPVTAGRTYYFQVTDSAGVADRREIDVP
jgi:hypothetical protein